MHQSVARHWRAVLSVVAAAAGLLVVAPTSEAAPVSHTVSSPTVNVQAARSAEAYWTPERMASAVEHPLERRAGQARATAAPSSKGTPGFVNGGRPAAQFADAEDAAAQSGGGTAQATDVQPVHGSYPGPYSRWLPFGKFTNYPLSTIDKMFFTQNGGNFVCSASQVNVDRVLTAGHCVHSGGTNSHANWSTNVLFCPSYNASGVNPNRGCWGVIQLATSTEWFVNGNFDRDWGGAHTQSSGTVFNAEIGNVTGWLGRAWNFSGEAVLASGYPAASPFNGTQIHQCASSEWYTQSWGAGADSVYIGCDMTGGSSGGPWVLKWGRPGQAGGSGNWVDGLNSHKRCTQAGCPAGSVLTEEMGSPPFTTEAGGSEQFFADLFAL